jgi:UDP-4-amino-4,6-dideoxy-N-acetyl-beta-L-altrosamine transaminase
MSGEFLPYGRQWIDEDDVQAVAEVLRGDWLTTGPLVSQFEQALASSCGCRRAVAVSSGTAALHCAYAALRARSDRTEASIVTTPLTFAATANAALYCGLKVIFADVDPETGNLDPEAARAVRKEDTVFIAAVDYAGHPADYHELRTIGLPVVGDAAHSLGAAYRGQPVGSVADLTATSLHPVKPITSGEGGAVMTNDGRAADWMELFRSHGVERRPENLIRSDGGWYYEMQMLGYNYRLTDLQCALALSQLRKLEAFVARRREIAARYTSALDDLGQIMLPSVRPYVEPGWHLYVIRVREAARRRPLYDRLRELGIGAQVHYIPVYRLPYYESLGYRQGLCPNAEAFYESAISLPIFPKMSDSDVDSAIERIRRAVGDTC